MGIFWEFMPNPICVNLMYLVNVIRKATSGPNFKKTQRDNKDLMHDREALYIITIDVVNVYLSVCLSV